MDRIFKALNDPTRRDLLDALRDKDGQTLSELEERLEMTRFGVMKHLKMLEEAHLITTRKSGRFKYHYLNAVPLQEVIDRWIEPLLHKQTARAVLNLKTVLETKMSEKPDFVLETLIRTNQDTLWAALIDPKEMEKYHFFSNKIECADGAYSYYNSDDKTVAMICREISTKPKSEIVSTFEPQMEGDGKPSKTIFRISPEGNVCKLTVEHYNVTFPVVVGEGIHDGWSRWAAHLKTYLETGKAIKNSS
ncbi:MAG: metalloregulator ArsR/SmtB family transcription factor [Pseudomonadota bacterium]